MERHFTFSKSEKLTGETAVSELFAKGDSFLSYPIRAVWLVSTAEKDPGVKVLMSVPKKKLKRAVDRNRVKRMLREAYRLQKHELSSFVQEQSLEVNLAFVWIPNVVLDYEKIERKMQDALVRLRQKLQPEELPHGA